MNNRMGTKWNTAHSACGVRSELRNAREMDHKVEVATPGQVDAVAAGVRDLEPGHADVPDLKPQIGHNIGCQTPNTNPHPTSMGTN